MIYHVSIKAPPEPDDSSICRWLCWRHRQINIKAFLSHSFEDWDLEFVTFVSKFNLLFDYLKRWEKSIFPLQSTLDIIVGVNLIELGVFLNLFCFIVVVDYCFLKLKLLFTQYTLTYLFKALWITIWYLLLISYDSINYLF